MPRDWRSFPRRFIAETNSAGGAVGLAGAGITGTGYFIAATNMAIFGGVVFCATTALCAYRAIPPKKATPQALMDGDIFDLSSLDTVHPPLSKIAFVGTSRTGKTTLLSYLNLHTPVNVRTENPYATVVRLPGSADTFLAFLDAAGQQYTQQFRIVDDADIIVVLMDHNEGAADLTISSDRMRVHENFLEQLLAHMRLKRKNPKQVHFVLNKMDLWQSNSGRSDLERWFNQQVRKLGNFHGIKISSNIHSNLLQSDINEFIRRMREWVR